MLREIGTVVQLRGKTVRGKNRINRGLSIFMVKRHHPEWGMFMVSLQNDRECFWVKEFNDPHMEFAIECR